MCKIIIILVSAHNNTFEGIKSISTNENIMESFQPSLDIQEKIQNVENEEALVAGESCEY